MEKILEKTNKVIVSDKSGNLMVLPLEQLLKNKGEKVSTPTVNQNSDYNFNMPSSSEALKSTPQTASESQKSATTSNNSSTSNTARTMRTMGQ